MLPLFKRNNKRINALIGNSTTTTTIQPNNINAPSSLVYFKNVELQCKYTYIGTCSNNLNKSEIL